jgi:hypothetical protein
MFFLFEREDGVLVAKKKYEWYHVRWRQRHLSLAQFNNAPLLA